MDWFTKLTKTATDFFSTPAGAKLVGITPATQAQTKTATASALPTWLLPVVIGGVVLAVAILLFRRN